MHAVLRARAAPPARHDAAAAVAQPAALRRRPARLARGQRRAASTTTGAIPSCPSRSTPTATTSAIAGTTPTSSGAGWIRCSDDLPQPRLRRLLPDRRDDLLAAAAPRRRTCCCSAASYVFYGWVHPWFVLIMLASTTVDYWAGQRMEDDPARKTPLPGGQPRREPRHARRLQVLQLLRRERARRARRAGAHGGAAAARDRAAGRHLVLHLPGAQLHRGRLQGRDARAPQPDRLRALRRLLPAPGGRADHARAEPAGAGGAAARVGRRRWPARGVRAGRVGPLQEAGHRRQRRRRSPTACSRSRTRPSRCCGPASSPSACRSTPTSPPTRTSRAAWPAGSASS